MALRAGYYGIKKNLLAAISNLAGAKIIKSIGDGLKLTSAGKLSCDINPDTMEFKNGKLSSKGGSVNYSLDEVATGKKWVDGRDVYKKTFIYSEITGNTFNSPVLNLDIDIIVDLFAYIKLGTGGGNTWVSVPFIETASYFANCNYHGNNDRFQFVSGNWGLTDAIVTILYVKKEGE